jgi:hypothetical protein
MRSTTLVAVEEDLRYSGKPNCEYREGALSLNPCRQPSAPEVTVKVGINPTGDKIAGATKTDAEHSSSLFGFPAGTGAESDVRERHPFQAMMEVCR